MKTITILEQLEYYAENDPGRLSAIDWYEVRDCLIAELNCISDIYPSKTYDSIINDLNNLSTDAYKASQFKDYYSLQKIIATFKGMLKGFPIEFDDSVCASKARFSEAALRHYRDKSTIVIGDSHVVFFSGVDGIDYVSLGNGINYCPQHNKLNLSTIYIGSCLAYNCMKTESRVGFYNKFLFLKENFIQPNAKILLSMGEIDLRCHVFKEAMRQKKEFQIIVDDILEKYRCFISALIEEGYSIFCWGPIGTAKDSIVQDDKYPRYGTEIERNIATKYFSDKLDKLCAEEGARFLSIFDKLIDDKMETRPEYLSSDHFHIGPQAMDIVIPVLKKSGVI